MLALQLFAVTGWWMLFNLSQICVFRIFAPSTLTVIFCKVFCIFSFTVSFANFSPLLRKLITIEGFTIVAWLVLCCSIWLHPYLSESYSLSILDELVVYDFKAECSPYEWPYEGLGVWALKVQIYQVTLKFFSSLFFCAAPDILSSDICLSTRMI